jgi:AmmeMemoRadiSam system protein A
VLSPAQGDELLALARTALRAHLSHEAQPSLAYPQGHPFQRPAGAFVTLRLNGRLRGCIGQTEPVRALAEVVAAMAVAAATRDPRFSPVPATELDALGLEVSVLGALVACGVDEVAVGRDGLVVVGKGQRGLLLPEVATQQQWTAQQFVEHTAMKAGLPRDAVPGQADLFRFQTQHFSEA